MAGTDGWPMHSEGQTNKLLIVHHQLLNALTRRVELLLQLLFGLLQEDR